MKKIIAFTLSFLLLLSAAGCAAPAEAEITNLPAEASAAEEPEQQPSGLTPAPGGDYLVDEVIDSGRSEALIPLAETAAIPITQEDVDAAAEHLADAASRQDAAAFRDALQQMEQLYRDISTNDSLATLRARNGETVSDEEKDLNTTLETLVLYALMSTLHKAADTSEAFLQETLTAEQFSAVMNWTEYNVAELNSLTTFENELMREYADSVSMLHPVRDWLSYVFVDMVKTNNQIAQLQGYENYADYSYAVTYGRAVTPAESRAIWDIVKTDFAPLYHALADVGTSAAERLNSDPSVTVSSEEIVQTVSELAKTLSPDLDEPLQAMQTYGLYNIVTSHDYGTGSFTVYLPSYSLPVLFVNPNGTWNDWFYFTHEFGHYSSLYFRGEKTLWTCGDMDLRELQSMGSELLSIHLLKSHFSDDVWQDLRDAELFSILTTSVNCALFDEFMQRVFTEPELTQERCNEIYLEVAGEYGFDTATLEADAWTFYPQSIMSPFYGISYCVDSLSALQLYVNACENPEGALRAYLQIMKTDSTVYSLSDALEKTGLPNYRENPEAAAALAGQVREILLAE